MSAVYWRICVVVTFSWPSHKAMDADQQADRLLGADLLERRGTVGEVASPGTAGGPELGPPATVSSLSAAFSLP